jgi:dTDP-L-rhamnose 4-epimerase
MKRARRALVTGGAGLIGSHITDELLKAGWTVRIFDNLEPQTHKNGRPSWIAPDAQFIQGDMRNRDDLEKALVDIDVIFHEAAYGGYMPEIAKYVDVNSHGTALMLEIIREKNFPIKKIIVASSQAVYTEGAAHCSKDGIVFPKNRSIENLARSDFEVYCPLCNAMTTSIPTPETAPIGGETVYALTKVDQERLVLMWGRQVGIPTIALRYACTYGPRQSLFNPYTGVITIFATRLLNGQPPVIYEDGNQTRDLCFVEDIARANLLAADRDELDGLSVNIGSGRAYRVHEVASLVGDALGIHYEPLMRGEYRPGEMRHLQADITRAKGIGYAPEVDLKTGIEHYVEWIRKQGSIKDYFAEAEKILKQKKIVHATIH